MSRCVVLGLAFALATADPSSAQTSSRQADPPTDPPAFLSRFGFLVGIEHIVSSDPRFMWDAYTGAELDVVDYGVGAMTLLAAYQAILGEEFRQFDPNQGNYTLAGSGSVRAGPIEAAGVFHHVSRHLSDRPKRFPVDWNMIGVRIRSGMARGRSEMRTQVDLRRVIQKTFVDYRWEVDGGARGQVRLSPRVALFADGAFRVVGVDGSRERGNQYGWRTDGGIRLDGRAAALELFVAGERVIDPYQLEFSTATWLTTGFRLVSR